MRKWDNLMRVNFKRREFHLNVGQLRPKWTHPLLGFKNEQLHFESKITAWILSLGTFRVSRSVSMISKNAQIKISLIITMIYSVQVFSLSSKKYKSDISGLSQTLQMILIFCLILFLLTYCRLLKNQTYSCT